MCADHGITVKNFIDTCQRKIKFVLKADLTVEIYNCNFRCCKKILLQMHVR